MKSICSIPRFQDFKIPGFQDSKFLGRDSIVPVNFCELPDSKKVSHMMQIDEINLFHSKIPRFKDSKFLGSDSIVPFNFCDLPDSQKVSHLMESSVSDFRTTLDPTYPAVTPPTACQGGQLLKGLLVPRGSRFFSVVCVMFSSVHKGHRPSANLS